MSESIKGFALKNLRKVSKNPLGYSLGEDYISRKQKKNGIVRNYKFSEWDLQIIFPLARQATTDFPHEFRWKRKHMSNVVTRNNAISREWHVDVAIWRAELTVHVVHLPSRWEGNCRWVHKVFGYIFCSLENIRPVSCGEIDVAKVQNLIDIRVENSIYFNYCIRLKQVTKLWQNSIF